LHKLQHRSAGLGIKLKFVGPIGSELRSDLPAAQNMLRAEVVQFKREADSNSVLSKALAVV
jgi:hypothetical protein